MNIQKNLTSVNRTVKTNRPITYIVMHYFGALGSAKDTCAYFKAVDREASAHYFVDDDGIWQCVEDKDVAWHCGDSGRGTMKGKCLNANSIGIEMRPYKVDTSTQSASDRDWYITDATVANAVELVKSLMAKYGIDSDHVIRHYDVTAKWCPRPFVGDDINTHYGKSGNEMWATFKARLTESEDEEVARYNTIEEVPEWGRPTVQKLIDKKYLSGDGAGLNLSEDMVRTFVINDRAGVYGA